MITRALLRSLRNDLPMPFMFRQLGDKAPYSKSVEGRFRFQCPHCGETQAVVNPRNNLAHCFHCGTNINNIDLLLALGYEFVDAVGLLQRWLRLYNAERAGPDMSPRPATPVQESNEGATLIGPLLQREFGNRCPSR